MSMDRRRFLKTAAGLLVGATALSVPERRVWALDRTMVAPYRGHAMDLPLQSGAPSFPLADIHLPWQNPLTSAKRIYAVQINGQTYQVDPPPGTSRFRIHLTDAAESVRISYDE